MAFNCINFGYPPSTDPPGGSKLFRRYGEIVNINLVRDRKTGKSKGFGFICYEDQRSTVLAVDNFSGTKLLGRILRVDHVENYRVPELKGDEDDMTKSLFMEGCAPTPHGVKDEETFIKAIKPKKKKIKKEKKEKKKKRNHPESSTDEKHKKRIRIAEQDDNLPAPYSQQCKKSSAVSAMSTVSSGSKDSAPSIVDHYSHKLHLHATESKTPSSRYQSLDLSRATGVAYKHAADRSKHQLRTNDSQSNSTYRARDHDTYVPSRYR